MKINIHTTLGSAEHEFEPVKPKYDDAYWKRRYCSHEYPLLHTNPPLCSECGQKMKPLPTHVPDYD